MAGKRFIGMVVMVLLVAMACVEVGEGRKLRKLSHCVRQCIPTCMLIDGADSDICRRSCENACRPFTRLPIFGARRRRHH
ncbi:conserved hypothetical protein [Ricinus communis]|uniref:Uncharacterized protein n=1 Tax=Ricinus communis TaxID=3988 RepID=B9STV6_RICCO|nr:conserved hypothetical protein [Ricinus communis]